MMENADGREVICLTLAEAVRDASRAGRLIGREELLAGLKARGLLDTDKQEPPDMEVLMAETLAVHQDLAALQHLGEGRRLRHLHDDSPAAPRFPAGLSDNGMGADGDTAHG